MEGKECDKTFNRRQARKAQKKTLRTHKTVNYEAFVIRKMLKEKDKDSTKLKTIC